MAVTKKYRSVVRNATVAAGGIGVPGAFSFGADVAAMSGTWVVMVLAIADRSGHKVDRTFATKLVASVLAGVGSYVAGSKIAMKMLHLLPGIGTLGAIGVNSSLNALFTYKMGHALSKLFDRGNFDQNDFAEMASTLLILVACVPSFDEARDLVGLMTEST